MTIRSGKEHTTRYLFGQRACAADAMYAPVCSRFVTYDVALDDDAAGYSRTIMDNATIVIVASTAIETMQLGGLAGITALTATLGQERAAGAPGLRSGSTPATP
jgi:glutathione S-transferase